MVQSGKQSQGKCVKTLQETELNYPALSKVTISSNKVQNYVTSQKEITVPFKITHAFKVLTLISSNTKLRSLMTK